MFTGIIQATGEIRKLTPRGGDAQLIIATGGLDMGDVALGDSIAVNGVCLTAITFDAASFTADVSGETLSRTTLGDLTVGSRVNLEKALIPTTRLGGHLVSGHVDGTATVAGIRDEGNARIFTFTAEPALTRQMIQRGSVAIDGISLTLIAVEEGRFSVSIIPHTLQVTNLGQRRLGDTVNIETDLIGKYVLSFLEPLGLKDGGMDRAFLAEHGFL
jgi:riboflavin synthase